MTTYTIFSDAADDGLLSADSTYATAQTGGAFFFDTQSGFLGDDIYYEVGQQFDGIYVLLQGLPKFVTSGVVGVVSSAVLSMYNEAYSADNAWTAEAFIYDWGAAVTTADWRNNTQLGALTKAATLASSAMSTSAYNAFTDVALPANINQAGTTHILLASSRQRTNTAPGSGQYEKAQFSSADVSGTTQDPKLVIEAAAGGGAPPFNPFPMHYHLTR